MYRVLQCEVCGETYSIDFDRKRCFKVDCDGELHKVEVDFERTRVQKRRER